MKPQTIRQLVHWPLIGVVTFETGAAAHNGLKDDTLKHVVTLLTY